MTGYAGRQGRKPTPTATKILTGNPGKRPLPANEPKPRQGRAACPAWLLPEAKREWKRVEPELRRIGVLTVVDRAALVGYCQAWAMAAKADRWIAENGTTIVMRDKDGRVKAVSKAPQVSIASDAWAQVRAFGAELGITPSSRSRVSATPKQEEEDPMVKLLGGMN